MSDDPLPEPDRIAGAPHPRETPVLYGQNRVQEDFLEAYRAGRLHSGWLITGPRGVGKATLAWKIATFLLSDPGPHATSLAVDPAHSDVRLIKAGAHPRLAVIRRPWDPKTKRLKSEITVDAVRALKTFFHMSAADGGRRVVIVDAADEMNRNAANAILKELEEPPANCTLLLIAHQPMRLLPTLRSRCRILRCARLNADDLQNALEQSGHASVQAESLTTLAAGSAGDAIRLLHHDGLPLYADLVKILSGLPRIDRPAALRLADSCTGRGADMRFDLTLDLVALLLSRAAHAGIMGAPVAQGAPGEARLLARIAPDDRAARRWAQLQQDLTERSRHGRAVNLDPAALILDMIFKIEEVAQVAAKA